MAVLKMLGWSSAGDVVAALLAFGGCILMTGPKVLFGPGDSNEIQAWSWFITYKLIALGAGVGFLVGAIYGAARWWGRKTNQAKSMGQAS